MARCINLAAASLLATEFVADISSQLQANPKAAAKLWIDMPEALAAAHPGVIQESLAALAQAGGALGLEHAGAAWPGWRGCTRSASTTCASMRVTWRGIGGDVDVRRHAEGLVSLLRGIGLGVYAEGVVHAEDLQVLWSLGFDGATGLAVTQR